MLYVVRIRQEVNWIYNRLIRILFWNVRMGRFESSLAFYCLSQVKPRNQ